jgi:DNA-binding MarR family transcriptional regulator
MLDHAPESTDEELQTEAVELERLLTAVLRGIYRPHPSDPLIDLTSAQIRMMRALEAGPEPASTVGDQLCLSVSAVTQVANRLENLGLITRTGVTTDRRVKLLSLTSLGREWLDQRNRFRIERVQAALGRIAPEDRASILRSLRTLDTAWQAERAVRKARKLLSEPDESSAEELSNFAVRLHDAAPNTPQTNA